MPAEKCDASSAAVFIIGLIAGTGCIISSKALFELSAVGVTGEVEPFRPPVFPSFVMFFGMLFALPMYWFSEAWKRIQARGDPQAQADLAKAPKVTFKMLCTLGVPAVFDLSSVILMMAGLIHINASMWMLLRGGGIVFVALMKQFVLGDTLTVPMWVGVFTISLAVALVGMSSMLNEPSDASTSADEGEGGTDVGGADGELFGVMLTIAGTFMQSLQYVYEEKVMSGDNPAPPWLLIGMEGLFGSVLCVMVVYPLAAIVPGADHGVFEDLDNTLAKLDSNPLLVQLSVVFCVLVFILNSFSVLVTYMLSSVWHAILDNFRPISIWAVELAIYYVFTNGEHGEKWETGSYLQLLGLLIMLTGTAIYNGTIALPFLHKQDLLASGDLRSTPSLTRSPLLSRQDSPHAVPFPGTRSPYAQRATVDGADPMERGDPGGLTMKLVVK